MQNRLARSFFYLGLLDEPPPVAREQARDTRRPRRARAESECECSASLRALAPRGPPPRSPSRPLQALYAHERRAGAYSDGAYFCAVVLCDLLLVRMLPPLSFAVVTYRWIGLKTVGEHVLYVFAACLVLTNVSASLVASAIGASRPSTAVANVAGALVSLFFALFGGFILSKEAIPQPLQWMLSLNPLHYAYEVRRRTFPLFPRNVPSLLTAARRARGDAHQRVRRGL